MPCGLGRHGQIQVSTLPVSERACHSLRNLNSLEGLLPKDYVPFLGLVQLEKRTPASSQDELTMA